MTERPDNQSAAEPVLTTVTEETVAMSMCSMALAMLDPQAQARVIRWLSDRYIPGRQ